MQVYNILITDEIGEDGVTASYVRGEIKKAKASGANHIRVVINSPGGEVYEGYDIYNALQSIKADGFKVTTYVTGQCASIATLIACAGDEIISSPVSQWMFHAPSGGARGTAQQLKDQAEALEQIKETMARTYASRMGKSLSDGLALMSRGDYHIQANQLAEMGFISSVAVPPSAVSTLVLNKSENMALEKLKAQAEDLLNDIKKALSPKAQGGTPTAGSMRFADKDASVYFNGETVVEGTVLYLNEDMTETAPEGDHVFESGLILTTDATGAVVRIAEIESKKYTEEEMQAKVDEAVASAIEAKQAEIDALATAHTTALQALETKVVALNKAIVSDKKPAPVAKAVQPVGKEDETKSSLDLQAKELKRQMGLK